MVVTLNMTVKIVFFKQI